MYGHPPVKLHQAAINTLENAGQRRDLLIKLLRRIQQSPELGGDIQWGKTGPLPEAVEVSVVAGFTVSWLQQNGDILILDIRDH